MSKESRMSGGSITEVMEPLVKCISHTQYPLETLFSVWHGSRHSTYITPQEINKLLYGYEDKISDRWNRSELIHYLMEEYPQYISDPHPEYAVYQIINKVVQLALKVGVQNAEFVSYEFMVDHASVAWREQLVRKRQLHVWTQTSRVADMTTFNATMLPTVEMMGGSNAVAKYKEAVQCIRDTYKTLIDLGVPSEDIRLQPQSHVHRVYFGCNLRQLIDLVKDRTSWIAQATLWMPIVTEIVKILASTIGPWIREYLKSPAVVKDGKIVEYDLLSDDEARYYGHDPLPVSPIYLAYTNKPNNYTNKEFYDYLKSMYIEIWPDNIIEALDWDRFHPEIAGRYDVGYKGNYWNS